MPALLWSGSGRTRGWLGYLGAVGLGAGALALASLWTSGAWATGIGAAVTTLSGLLAERLAPGDPPGAGAAELLRTPAGRIPRLRQVDRPELAGAHPAETPGAAPAYIERDAAPRLRAALAGGGFVLVVGESTAGKTRLAYEVTRARHPRHAFVRPLSRAALPEAVRIAARRMPRRAVAGRPGGLPRRRRSHRRPAGHALAHPGRRDHAGPGVPPLRRPRGELLPPAPTATPGGPSAICSSGRRCCAWPGTGPRRNAAGPPPTRRTPGSGPRCAPGSASGSPRSSPPGRSCAPPGRTPGRRAPTRGARPSSRRPWTAAGPGCGGPSAASGCARCTPPTWRRAAAATSSPNPSRRRWTGPAPPPTRRAGCSSATTARGTRPSTTC